MKKLSRSKTAAAGLLATAVVCGALALGSPAASAGDSPVPLGVSSGGGAVDLQGNPVETRTYVGKDLPDDLGTLECSATVSADGTVTDQQGDCSGLQAG